MKNMFRTLLFSLLCSSAVAANPDITCTISVKNAVVRQGQSPQVKVAIKNRSDKEFVLVKSLDASDCGWRYPKCGFVVTRADRKPLPRWSFGKCGNMNLLRATDFVRVGAGKDFTPLGQEYMGSTMFRIRNLPPGAYLLKFYYQTSTKGVEAYFGDERMMKNWKVSPEIQGLYAGVSELNLWSNELKFTIRR